MSQQQRSAAMLPRVACVSDLSGFGRCSLAVALPILSAMGFQACPLPTMLLSAHTGYEQPYIRDLTADIAPYLAHWQHIGLQPDAVFTGFLGNERQVSLLEPLLQQARQRGAPVLVDPAMADHGRLYTTCTPALAAAMRRLLALATVATPNLTEACLLAGEEYHSLLVLPEGARVQAIDRVGQKLLALGCGAAVITGIPCGEQLENAVYETGRPPAHMPVQRVDCSFAGTGDVFSAVLCGALLRGEELHAAVAAAAAFVYRSAVYTAQTGSPEQEGILFEPFLASLSAK